MFTITIPEYCLKAFVLIYKEFGQINSFKSSFLDGYFSQKMKEKILHVLVQSGWIERIKRGYYRCKDISLIFSELFDFKVPKLLQQSQKDYALYGSSALEIWTEGSYVQRSREKSPYFIRIFKKDLDYWKNYFRQSGIPCYIKKGTSVGEFVIFDPVTSFKFTKKGGFKVMTKKDIKAYIQRYYDQKVMEILK